MSNIPDITSISDILTTSPLQSHAASQLGDENVPAKEKTPSPTAHPPSGRTRRSHSGISTPKAKNRGGNSASVPSTPAARLTQNSPRSKRLSLSATRLSSKAATERNSTTISNSPDKSQDVQDKHVQDQTEIVSLSEKRRKLMDERKALLAENESLEEKIAEFKRGHSEVKKSQLLESNDAQFKEKYTKSQGTDKPNGQPSEEENLLLNLSAKPSTDLAKRVAFAKALYADLSVENLQSHETVRDEGTVKIQQFTLCWNKMLKVRSKISVAMFKASSDSNGTTRPPQITGIETTFVKPHQFFHTINNSTAISRVSSYEEFIRVQAKANNLPNIISMINNVVTLLKMRMNFVYHILHGFFVPVSSPRRITVNDEEHTLLYQRIRKLRNSSHATDITKLLTLPLSIPLKKVNQVTLSSSQNPGTELVITWDIVLVDDLTGECGSKIECHALNTKTGAIDSLDDLPETVDGNVNQAYQTMIKKLGVTQGSIKFVQSFYGGE